MFTILQSATQTESRPDPTILDGLPLILHKVVSESAVIRDLRPTDPAFASKNSSETNAYNS